MDKKKVIETLFDKKIIKILRLLINYPTKEFHLREISKMAKVSPATTFRILKTLKDLELIEEKKNKYLKVYTAHQRNISIFNELLEDKSAALREFVEITSSIEGIQQIMLHGEGDKDKANIIILGDEQAKELVNSKVIQIKEKFGFSIIYMLLSGEHYQQMSSMGLISGKKVVLYTR